jgi:class 3 adenylate cyclase
MATDRSHLQKPATLVLLGVAFATLGWAAWHWPMFFAPLPFQPIMGPRLSTSQLTNAPSGWPHAAAWACVAAAVMAPALLALVLLRRMNENRDARHLGAALAGLAAVFAHWGFVIPLELLPVGAPSLAADVASGFVLAWALRELTAFSCEFPRPVDIEAMGQWAAAQRQVRDGPGPAWLTRFRRWAGQEERLSKWRKENAPDVVAFVLSGRAVGLLGAVMAAGVCLSHPGAGMTALRKISPMGLLTIIFPVMMYVMWIVGALSWNLRTGTEEERRKIFWIYWGGVVAYWIPMVAMCGGFISALFGVNSMTLVTATACLGGPVATILIVLGLAIAIFFHGAVDPRLAITRTSVIGLFGLALPPLILTTERFLQHGILEQLQLPAHSTTWAFIGVTAVTFRPLSQRLERWLGGKLDDWLPASALAGAERARAVIGFVDLSGYTALSAQDEKAALTHAAALHKAGRAGVSGHGRVVKTLGDAVLWESPDALQAVTASRALQRAYLAEIEREGLKPLPLHFGLHAGEIVRARDGDVFGSTVNVAARLLGQAEGGQIIASGEVIEGLAGQRVSLQPLGARKLKNVPEPVSCFLISATEAAPVP